MARIVVPDDYPSIFAGTQAHRLLQEAVEVAVHTDKASSEEELVRRLQGFEAAVNIRAYSKFTESVMRACPALKLIAVLGIGTDNVDLAAASRLEIKVCNTPGYSAVSVAEHALALMLAAARKIPAHERELRAGKWTRLPMVQLHGKTLGIVGFGSIGRQLAILAKGIGMEVAVWTFHPDEKQAAALGIRFAALDRLLAEADVLSVNIKASEKTRHLIDRAALAKMKPSAILVNTARARIVDTAAMIAALRQGKLAAAALDVFDEEPLPAGDILCTLSNVILSPHNAGMTPEAIEKGNALLAENVIAFFQGRPMNLVNWTKGEEGQGR